MKWLKSNLDTLFLIFFVLLMYVLVAIQIFMYNNSYCTYNDFINHIPEILTLDSVEEFQAPRK